MALQLRQRRRRRAWCGGLLVHPKTFVNNGKFLMLKTCTSKLRMKLQIEVRNNSITKVLSTFSWFLLETESGFGGEKEKRG